MKAVKRFFIIGGVLLLLLSVITLVMNTELEYENKALCIYIDYAVCTLTISGAAFIVAIVFFMLSLDLQDDDFSHLTRKY